MHYRNINGALSVSIRYFEPDPQLKHEGKIIKNHHLFIKNPHFMLQHIKKKKK